MITQRTNTSVSRRASLTGLAAGGLGLVIAARGIGAAAAQDTTETANHPVVGTWRNVPDSATPPGLRLMIAIHGDGTMTSVHSFGGSGIGAWYPIDAHAVQWVMVWLNIADIPGQFVEGTVTAAGSLILDETGTKLKEETTVDIRAADDTVVANFPFMMNYVRVPFEAPPATDTPATATPTT